MSWNDITIMESVKVNIEQLEFFRTNQHYFDLFISIGDINTFFEDIDHRGRSFYYKCNDINNKPFIIKELPEGGFDVFHYVNFWSHNISVDDIKQMILQLPSDVQISLCNEILEINGRVDGWHFSDIIEQAQKDGYILNEIQAREVLKLVTDGMDANDGINYDTISYFVRKYTEQHNIERSEMIEMDSVDLIIIAEKAGFLIDSEQENELLNYINSESNYEEILPLPRIIEYINQWCSEEDLIDNED